MLAFEFLPLLHGLLCHAGHGALSSAVLHVRSVRLSMILLPHRSLEVGPVLL